jgi:hypothetical protein
LVAGFDLSAPKTTDANVIVARGARLEKLDQWLDAHPSNSSEAGFAQNQLTIKLTALPGAETNHKHTDSICLKNRDRKHPAPRQLTVKRLVQTCSRVNLMHSLDTTKFKARYSAAGVMITTAGIICRMAARACANQQRFKSATTPNAVRTGSKF